MNDLRVISGLVAEITKINREQLDTIERLSGENITLKNENERLKALLLANGIDHTPTPVPNALPNNSIV